MKLYSELFFKLCKDYGVKFSNDYDTLMFEEDDGTVREFTNEDIDRIFAPEVVKGKQRPAYTLKGSEKVEK